MKNHFATPQKIISKNKSTKLSPCWQKSQALKDLEKQTLEVKKLRYPNNHYLVGETFEDKTANGLTKAISTFLRLKGHQCERVANMGRPVDNRQTFTDVTGKTRQIGSLTWIKGNGQIGTSDLHCCIEGRAVYLEIKIGSDRQSAAQKNYERQVVSSFGIYQIVRTFENFVTWYNLKFDKP